jgi:hypothetical protein
VEQTIVLPLLGRGSDRTTLTNESLKYTKQVLRSLVPFPVRLVGAALRGRGLATAVLIFGESLG